MVIGIERRVVVCMNIRVDGVIAMGVYHVDPHTHATAVLRMPCENQSNQ